MILRLFAIGLVAWLLIAAMPYLFLILYAARIS